MEYCYLVWTGATNFYLDMLDELLKLIFPTFTVTLESSGLIFTI